MEYDRIDINRIKLVIWDLDDTFWKGTLSDHEQLVESIDSNIELVRKLAARGIPSSICSKNDKEAAQQMLQSLNIWDYFVFCSINWEPKGARLQSIIQNMSLRAENVLFIDDNPSNLAEARFIMPDLMVALPDIIQHLWSHCDTIGKDDRNLSRLQQYKILEKKHLEAENFSSNLEFLKSSCIKVCIRHNVEENAVRICELIQRSNQLNFTKKRISIDEVLELASDTETECGYVEVADKYGVYGLVGFYAIKNGVLEHFLFSCRVMGMGIEQFLLAYLHYPQVTVVEPVSATLSYNQGMPDYISLVDQLQEENSKTEYGELSLLIKGSCDLQVMAAYIESNNIQETLEFNFVDSLGNQADFYNHTVNILNTLELDRELLDQISQQYPFLSKEAYHTSLMDVEYDCVFLSIMMDATLSVYRHKEYGFLLAYGVYNKPMTESAYWAEYIEKNIMTARNDITAEQLQSFSQEFEHIEYTPDMAVYNLKKIISKRLDAYPHTKFIIPLLPELPFDESKIKIKNDFAGKEKIHQAINLCLRKEFENEQHIFLLDVNQFIKKQSDYFDSINHYSKLVYYQMANAALDYINTVFNKQIRSRSVFLAIYDNFKRMLYKSICLRNRRKL